MKLTKRYREKWSLKCRAAAWRMANVDDLRNLRYDSGAITRGRHAQRLCYKIMSGRMDLISSVCYEMVQSDEASPLHHVIINGLKGCWTPSNRSVAMKLYDSYSRAQRLKKSLSADAVQGFKLDATQTQTPQVCTELRYIHTCQLVSKYVNRKFI